VREGGDWIALEPIAGALITLIEESKEPSTELDERVSVMTASNRDVWGRNRQSLLEIGN